MPPMATAYEFTGPQEQEYPGYALRVSPGDIVRLDGRPPQDGNFREVPEDVEPTAVAGTEPPAPDEGDGEESTEGDEDGDEPKQPNLAASGADWAAYALAMKVPQAVVEASTRKQLVEHFRNGTELPEVESTEDGEGEQDNESNTEGGTPPAPEGE